MKLNLYVLTSKRIIWDCEVKEIILSTNSGQIGVCSRQSLIVPADPSNQLTRLTLVYKPHPSPSSQP
jgi:hypothetical protein